MYFKKLRQRWRSPNNCNSFCDFTFYMDMWAMWAKVRLNILMGHSKSKRNSIRHNWEANTTKIRKYSYTITLYRKLKNWASQTPPPKIGKLTVMSVLLSNTQIPIPFSVLFIFHMVSTNSLEKSQSRKTCCYFNYNTWHVCGHLGHYSWSIRTWTSLWWRQLNFKK